MTKTEFTKALSALHKGSIKDDCIDFMHDVTRLSTDLCTKLVTSLWGCSDPKSFGSNMYGLLEAAADADSSHQFSPKVKTNSCTIYIIYPDDHAAAFALYKIKQYSMK